LCFILVTSVPAHPLGVSFWVAGRSLLIAAIAKLKRSQKVSDCNAPASFLLSSFCKLHSSSILSALHRMPEQPQLEPFAGWIYLCSSRKRRWAKTSRNEFELCISKNPHALSQQLGSFWLPQCVVRDTQQEHQQPFCLAIECADGVRDVFVADDADAFMALMQAIKARGDMFHSVPSGGYAHHRNNIMMKDEWNLCWAVIEEQFLTLWKSKAVFDAAATSSSIGGMGGVVQPMLVLPLMCATVIQCTDNVTISVDLHQDGRVVATHFLYLSSAASCAAWMAGFLKAVGIDPSSSAAGSTLSATPTIATLDLHFPQPHELVKTPEPGGMTLPAGATIVPKEPKVLPDLVYGSVEQRAAAYVPPLPDNDERAWAPLPAAELSKISAALGDPIEAIGAHISASLSWFRDKSRSFSRADAAAGDAAAPSEAVVAASGSRVAPGSQPESSASTQRSGPISQSLQTAQTIRHRQPAALTVENGATCAGDAAQPASDTAQALPFNSPSADGGSGLLSTLPLPECRNPLSFAFRRVLSLSSLVCVLLLRFAVQHI
jgi:hypothetical protein